MVTDNQYKFLEDRYFALFSKMSVIEAYLSISKNPTLDGVREIIATYEEPTKQEASA